MASFKDRIKKQVCIHWQRIGTTSYGQPTWANPVDLACRWSDQVVKYVNAQGEEKVSNAVVFVDGVGVGDVLMLGSVSDTGLNESSPLQNSDAWEVKRVDSIPNLKNTVTWYKVYL